MKPVKVKMTDIKSVIKQSKRYIDNQHTTITLCGLQLFITDKNTKVYVHIDLYKKYKYYGSYKNIAKEINKRLRFNSRNDINTLKVV